MKFSANLGFLWSGLPLADAIRAAHRSGFDAVECHWPYDQPFNDVHSALTQTGLPMLGVNTRRGDLEAGEMGLAALPGRQDAARACIDQALGFAVATGTSAVHVMAGVADGAAARDTFLTNLDYAARAAAPHGITVLIEPLNPWDAPGYFLRDTDQAVSILTDLAADNAKLMFDCYHVGRVERDLIARLPALLPFIGHIQFAGVPDRGPPDQGALDYTEVFAAIDALGWTRPLGAEYRVSGATEDSLGWMQTLPPS